MVFKNTHKAQIWSLERKVAENVKHLPRVPFNLCPESHGPNLFTGIHDGSHDEQGMCEQHLPENTCGFNLGHVVRLLAHFSAQTSVEKTGQI